MPTVRACLALLLLSPLLYADGGQLRWTEERYGLRVSVFTSPTPPTVGLLDVSVLVQDANGKVRLGVPIRVRAIPRQQPSRVIEAMASTELATNKLLQSAHLELDRPGPWRLLVEVESVAFEGEILIEEAPESWWELLPWLTWPFVVIGLFVLKIFLQSANPRSSPASK